MKKIAVTYENGQVFQHFGHTQQFKIYEIADGKMTRSIVPVTCGGHSALAGMLEELGVDTLICGGIGMGAQVALDNADIALYAGITGSADEAVAKLLAGVLPQNASANCDHHDHHDHHHHDGCGCHEHGHHHHDGDECHCHDH
ncbi:MAG: dinitrogenase iron-molybdenum cofactor biosynthesis protein [Clostridia bacterium]|nr:dinitrogenase iron-molybdenum cofactor biosynthesis protein [Clostridia bacterium]